MRIVYHGRSEINAMKNPNTKLMALGGRVCTGCLFRIAGGFVCIFTRDHDVSHEADEQFGSGTDGIEGTLQAAAEQPSREENHGGKQARSHQNNIEQNDSLTDLFAEIVHKGEQKEGYKGNEIDADDTEQT